MTEAEKHKKLKELEDLERRLRKNINLDSKEEEKIKEQIGALHSQLGEACMEAIAASTSPELLSELVRHIQAGNDYFEYVRDVFKAQVIHIHYHGADSTIEAHIKTPPPTPSEPMEDYDTSAYKRWPLTKEAKGILVDYLLACPKMKDPISRYVILRDLPDDIRDEIKIHEDPKVHLLSIVNTCSEYKGGLEWLNDQVQFFEPGSEPTCKLNELFQQLCPKYPINWTQLTRLKHLLFTKVLCLPQEEDLIKIFKGCIPHPDRTPLSAKPEKTHWLVYFLDWLSNIDQRIPILKFVTRLLPYIEQPEPIQEWLVEVHAELGLPPIKPVQEDVSETASYYLLIQLKTPETQDTDDKAYDVHAWFFKEHHLIKKIYEKGRINSLGIMSDVLDEIIGSILTSCTSEFPTLEFLIPPNLFNYNIEELGAEEDEPIGIQYPVVLRSLDRLQRNHRKQSWNVYWNKNKERLQVLSEHCLVCMKNPEKKKKQLDYLEGGQICFNLQFIPETKYLTDITRSGTAIVLWPRQEASQDVTQQLQEALRNHPLQKLPELLKDIRLEAWDTHENLGNLSLLWDDPDRQPPGFEGKDEEQSNKQTPGKRLRAPGRS